MIPSAWMGHALAEVVQADVCSHPGPSDLDLMLRVERETGHVTDALKLARRCAECKFTLALVEEMSSK